MALITKKSGFIGAGQMASAIIRGLLDKKVIHPENIFIYDPSPVAQQKMKKLKVNVLPNEPAIVEHSDVIFMAVKPNYIPSVLENIHPALSKSQEKKLLVSIAAGVGMDTYLEALPENQQQMVRVMPNVNCLTHHAASCYSVSDSVTEEEEKCIRQIMGSVGTIDKVPEYMMHAVTGLSGSGPAYVYNFIAALADGGVLAGIPRPLALKLAVQTVFGSAHNMIASEEHPSVLKDTVASPGGTTIHGVHAMHAGGVHLAMMDAVKAAAERSKELSEPAPKKPKSKL